MAQELMELDPSRTDPDEADRVYGVAVAKVLSNLDLNGEGRVQISLPWLPGFEPWARVCSLMGGSGRGTYFIPQVNDEVLVAFNQGDIREPYVIGGLWSTMDRPPALLQTDPINKRVIRTPRGHQIEFDDLKQQVSVSNSLGQTVTLTATGVEISAGTIATPGQASVKLDATGAITIESRVSLKLSAPSITINGKKLTLQADASASISGGASCTITGGKVSIN